MKSLHLNMYKKISCITAVMVVLTCITVKAQVTTQSPYSKFGVGNIKGIALPQFRAMGGISTGVYKPNGYSNVNMQNPASYPGINLTTVDIGIAGGFTTLKTGEVSENSFNSTLTHMMIGVPVSSRSALTFGVAPYTELGYQIENRVTLSNGANSASQDANYIYTGEGGINKAHIGYGYRFGKGLKLGGNVEYLFGNLLNSRSTELVAPDSVGSSNSINSRMQTKNSIGGFSFSYGIQYDIALNSKTSLVLGYSGSAASTVASTKSSVVTQYFKNSLGEEQPAIDTLVNVDGAESNFKLPLIHNFGFTIQKDNKWLIGADYRMGKWSESSLNGESLGLQDTHGYSVGAQITPDINSIGSYWNRVDYRIGYTYDKTYVQVNNQDVKQMAITFGFGLPLARSMSGLSFYKMNFTTEIGKRGNINNGLVQENFVNFSFGFTLNDKWFRKFKFD
ncbi:hypothetical protein [Pedobacter sp.]|uniref:hypothetical protein n=1 Tax=Pedobacter sp. TaxID=1411316 RepID=UPI003D7F63AB